MRIKSTRAIDGPNVYLYRPVLVAEVDLEDLAGRETREFEGFNERLTALLPGLGDHVCGLGVPGGLLTRLDEGTYFGHVVEHVALELSEPAGVAVNFGKTRATDDPRIYTIVLEYKSDPVIRLLLQTAVDLVDSLAHGHPFTTLEDRLAEARRLHDRTARAVSETV